MMMPDCTYCGEPVVLDIDVEGAVEVCTGCGIAQAITHQFIQPAVVTEIRRAVRARMRQRRECHHNRCRCPCHELERRLSA